MSFTVTHRNGEQVDGDVADLPALLAELDGPLDDEEPDVSVCDDATDWALSAFQTGLLVWENLEDRDGEPRHMEDVSRADVLRVMQMLARGELAGIESLDWQPGYGS